MGGLVGDANTGTDIAHSFAAGDITGPDGSNPGALAGWSNGVKLPMTALILLLIRVLMPSALTTQAVEMAPLIVKDLALSL